MRPVALTPELRASSRQQVGRQHLDIAVIGGGVTGAGAALDAACRGLSVGLFEATDFAAGTSSRSSKLLHGGLRYLEQLDFGLVTEALRERNLQLTTLAPHLARPVPFTCPLARRGIDRFYVGLGVLVYDILASLRSRRVLPRHRHLSRRTAAVVAPGLDWSKFHGAVRYFDAQVDDARHTLELIRTAATYGAHVLNGSRVVGLLERDGRVAGLVVEDASSGDRYEVTADVVINASGPWAGDVARLANTTSPVKLRPSKGVHILVDRSRINLDGGLIHRTATSVLFVIPWGPTWLIGTTDTPWSGDPGAVVADQDDIRFLLDEVNAVLADPVTPADILGVFAGLRPLADDSVDATAQVSREHTVRVRSGLVTITGGKYTTYRRMAAEVVDVAAGQIVRPVGRSITASVPLVGADGFVAFWHSRRELADAWGVPLKTVEHLLGRYGGLASEVLQLAAADRRLLEPVEPDSRYLAAEALYAVTHEGARTLEDVLARRTRVSIESEHGGLHNIDATAKLVGGPLGWGPNERAAAVTGYRTWLSTERSALQRTADGRMDPVAPGIGA